MASTGEVKQLLYAIAEGQGPRKARGAFYTPVPIAKYLADWAIAGRAHARLFDPSCGEGVFLKAGGEVLSDLGVAAALVGEQLYGVEINQAAVNETRRLLAAERVVPHLIAADFASLMPPTELFGDLGPFDAVIGNPPYVRYQLHTGAARRMSAKAALRQGVRLSGLASSWAALLVHAASFLKPDGRLAMVLPAELLSVGYAEPIRRWLRRRFGSVTLVLFERLQFHDAMENVVLLMAEGEGGCSTLSLSNVRDGSDLQRLRCGTPLDITPSSDGRWIDLLLPVDQRELFANISNQHFVPLSAYGAPELGTVTGANGYFALTEKVRRDYGLTEEHLTAISPPGTRHLRGLWFTSSDWEALREEGMPVWLLWPSATADDRALAKYLALGEQLGVPQAYKCRIRSPWWRPPRVKPADLFFTYMSHRFPRLVSNEAGVSFLNSMHGVRLSNAVPKVAAEALPLLAINSVTLLGAELHGRSYGGGVLKMEPREAAALPMPNFEAVESAWATLKPESEALDRELRNGHWPDIMARVDQVLLDETMGVETTEYLRIRQAAHAMRQRRLGRAQSSNGQA